MTGTEYLLTRVWPVKHSRKTLVSSPSLRRQQLEELVVPLVASKGAENDVRVARERGIPVHHRIEDVPGVRAQSSGNRPSRDPLAHRR
jgi:hypothetical protein